MAIRRPRLKVVRRLGTPLPGLTRKSADRKPHPPGAHGVKAARRRPSEYRRRLEEKQKVRFNYGITERQLRRYLERARTEPGRTGDALLSLLERRLDNVVFRLGFAATIPEARQLVVHGHVRVGETVVNKPGYSVRRGEVMALGDGAPRAAALRAAGERPHRMALPSYLERQDANPTLGRVIGTPVRADVPVQVQDALIVEYYAR
jgi:small subunit ribosomal protein S4